jgi:hypothetical protein
MDSDIWHKKAQSSQQNSNKIMMASAYPPSPSPTEFPKNTNPLELIRTPQEIQNCVWQPKDDKTHYMSHECACYELPRAACEDGYGAPKKRMDRQTLESNPNTAIQWCVSNVPDNFKNNEDDKKAWIIGCMSGVRGQIDIIRPN